MRVWRRLRELDQVCDEFLNAAAPVIQRCRTHDPRVMAHVHFDFTEDETHAALVHDCQPGDTANAAPGKPSRARGAPAKATRFGSRASQPRTRAGSARNGTNKTPKRARNTRKNAPRNRSNTASAAPPSRRRLLVPDA